MNTLRKNKAIVAKNETQSVFMALSPFTQSVLPIYMKFDLIH
jgi:hypothetical protein